MLLGGGAPKSYGIYYPECLLTSGLILHSPLDSTRETSKILTDYKYNVFKSFDYV